LLDAKQASGLPLQTVLALAKDIAEGLIYLQSQGIKYPILTSNNIVVQDTDVYGNPIPLTALLSDLGDAHVNWQDNDLGNASPSYLTQGKPGGLPRMDSKTYTPTPGTGMDSATLIYNYGVLLWELFTGLKPKSYLPPNHDASFKTRLNGSDVVQANEEYFLPEQVPEDCPRELANVIFLCWCKRPYLRMSLAEIVEVLQMTEQTYLGNAASILASDRINRTKVSFLNRIESILDYIDRVGSLSINVTDLIGSLEDLSDALEKARNLDLARDFAAADAVLEVLESIFPSRIIDKKSKQVNKYWIEYASSKKAKFKLERAIGQIVAVASDLRAKGSTSSNPNILANSVSPGSSLAGTSPSNSASTAVNVLAASVSANMPSPTLNPVSARPSIGPHRASVSSHVGSSKLVHQVLFDNLAPGKSLRIRSDNDLVLIANEEAENKQRLAQAAQPSNTGSLAQRNPANSGSPNQSPSTTAKSTSASPASSATNLLSTFGLSGSFSSGLGADSVAAATKGKDKKDAKKLEKEKSRSLKIDKKHKKAKSGTDPDPATIASGSTFDVLALASASSSGISTSVGGTTSGGGVKDTETTPSAPQQVAVDPSTMSTDDYLAALATGIVGKSVVQKIDVKGVTASSTFEKQDGVVIPVANIQGKQYYGEEIGFGPTRKVVAPSAGKTGATSSPPSSAVIPGRTPLTSTTTGTTSSTNLGTSTTGQTQGGSPGVSRANTLGGWNKAVKPSDATSANPATPTTNVHGDASTNTIAGGPKDGVRELRTKKSLFRFFKKQKKDGVDDDGTNITTGDAATTTTVPERKSPAVMIDSVPHVIQEREMWLMDSSASHSIEINWDGEEAYTNGMILSRPGPPGSSSSATSDEGCMPFTGRPIESAPGSTGTNDGECMPMVRPAPQTMPPGGSAPTGQDYSSDPRVPPLGTTPISGTETSGSNPNDIIAVPLTPTASGEVPPPSSPGLLNSAEFTALPVVVPIDTRILDGTTKLTSPRESPIKVTTTPDITITGTPTISASAAQEVAAVSERVRVISTRRISLVERLNWDVHAKEFWRLNFGITVNSVPWDRFANALSEHMLVLGDDLATLQQILDNNRAGYVTAATFAEFLNSHGSLSTALRRTATYRNQPWFMWYLSHDDCITMLKHCAPGTFAVRFSQSSPGQFALTVKQSAGAFMKCLIYAQQGKYKARPDDSVEYQDLMTLIKASSTTLIPFKESWHHNAWFKGSMSSEDSMELLSAMPVGDFFVRLSTRGPHYVLSIVVGPGAVIQEAFAREESHFVVFTQQGEIRTQSPNFEAFVKERREYHISAHDQTLASPSSSSSSTVSAQASSGGQQQLYASPTQAGSLKIGGVGHR
jgi:hypothetical protein